MRVTERALVVAVAAGLLALIPACGGGGTSGGGKPKVAVVTNCQAEFWTICEAGANKAAQEFNVDLDFRQPERLDVAVQKGIIDAELKVGVSGIAISVINPEEQTPYLKRVGSQAHYLAMDNDAPESGRLAYIGIDNYEAGKAVGRQVKKALPNGGTVALFIGGTASANAKARIGGVVDELAGQKDAKGPQLGKYAYYNNEPYTDATDEARAQSNAKAVIELLKDTPNVCLIGLYAYNPKTILNAYRSKKGEVKHPMKIVGFDEDSTTLDGVAKGEVEATVVQDPFQYGYMSVKMLAELARGGKAKDEPIPYRVVTKDGGPDETVNGIVVKNIKATDFEKKLREDIESGKKK